MGKGFNNYMTKKFFHPSSKENIKRVWMAQQKTEFEKKKQDDLLNQYQKEQEMYQNRALLGDEKAKLGLSFMYDAPPGLKKKEEEKEAEQEVKFEWQRKYNAPREQYAKNDEEIRDQPFGIEVRNVRCLKCRKWGHVNTDKICPLFNKDLAAEPPQPSSSAASLLEGMKEEGLTLKNTILGRMAQNPTNEKLLGSGDEDDPEVQFLKSLSSKQKKKLLKKLDKLQGGKSKKSKKDKKRKKKKKHRSSSASSESEVEDTRKKKKKRKPSESDSDSEADTKTQKRRDSVTDGRKDHYHSSTSNKKGKMRASRNPPSDSSGSDSDSSSEEEQVRGQPQRGGKAPLNSRRRSSEKNRKRSQSPSYRRSPEQRHSKSQRSRSRERKRRSGSTERSNYKKSSSKSASIESSRKRKQMSRSFSQSRSRSRSPVESRRQRRRSNDRRSGSQSPPKSRKHKERSRSKDRRSRSRSPDRSRRHRDRSRSKDMRSRSKSPVRSRQQRHRSRSNERRRSDKYRSRSRSASRERSFSRRGSINTPPVKGWLQSAEMTPGSRGSRSSIWIVGSSIVFWAHKRVSQQRDLNLGIRTSDALIEWYGTRGMRWTGLLPKLQELVRNKPPPDVLLLYVGSNDVGYVKPKDFVRMVKSDLGIIREICPNTTIIYNEILSRINWRGAPSNEEGEEERIYINKLLQPVLEGVGGSIIHHPDIRNVNRSLYRDDGVHLNDAGYDIFNSNMSEKIRKLLADMDRH